MAHSKIKLSKCYSDATSRMSHLSTELYESIHDENGNPLEDLELVRKEIQSFQRGVREEIDFIKSACREENEGN